MALTPRLEVRQSQSLTLTPQLMQSIRLLQLSHLELNAFVEAELERNPLLDRDESQEDGSADEAPAPAADPLDTVEQTALIGSESTISDSLDSEVSDVFPDQAQQDALSQPGHRELQGAAAEGGSDLEAYVAAEITLAEHLMSQIVHMLHTPADRLIARHLVDGLNEAGYFTGDCAEVAHLLGADIEDVEAVLERVQSCDPAGVFARDVAECLAIQLRERGRLDEMMKCLLANLHLVAARDMAGLCKVIGTDREDVQDMLAELRMLDPKPGRAFGAGPVETVVPDVFVTPAAAGGWHIELNTEVLPRVLVNRTYYANVTRRVRGPADKEFLADCLQTANWLTKSLDQRAQTILKVATEIVRQQDGFFVHGITHLRPMTLKLVAEAIEMHESTVSRVTSNKYMATPRGLFDMKYFFTTALASSMGEADHSAEAVRHRIRQLIAAEPADAILSDDTLAEMLRKELSIEVARRTVAKYREAMRIPSSVIRRREKRAERQSA